MDEQIVAGPRPTVVGRPRPATGRTVAREAALEAYHAHRGAVYGFALHLSRDPSTAEDLLQEAFCRLVDQLANREPPRETLPWLLRVVANLAVSRGRRQQVADRSMPRLVDHDTGLSAETHVLRREYGERVTRGLQELSHDERTALLLAAAGFDGASIARTIERSEGATRTLLFRARLRLQRLIDVGGDADA